jgi:hypothetical protein
MSVRYLIKARWFHSQKSKNLYIVLRHTYPRLVCMIRLVSVLWVIFGIHVTSYLSLTLIEYIAHIILQSHNHYIIF